MWSLVVFSHLRWDFVFQRPQQLMTRFAKRRKVFFIEEPVFDEEKTYVEVAAPADSIRVLRAHTPMKKTGFDDDQMTFMLYLLDKVLRRSTLGEHVAWFYTPMALPLLRTLSPRAVIYDCMDELSAFRGAPAQMQAREQELMEAADLVFTGGPSLYEAKRALRSDVHCFPSAVDSTHFARGGEGHPAHPALRELRRPRLGYYGVVDERLDLTLLAELADARREWQLCIVGPVVKISPQDLPRRPNIHYFGQQPYEQLPAFLAGWDVCLLPFALNESTRFISPTKTLEYMASGRPVVSTPIRDVSALYADVVRIAPRGPRFVEACEEALRETEQQARSRRMQMKARVSGASWDATASAMELLIEQQLSETTAADVRL